MSSNSVAIFANGEAVSAVTVMRFLSPGSLIIAADGGAELCRSLGLRPHYLVGDFDSLHEETKRFFSQAKIIERPSQDYTDLEKALQLALETGARSITVFAALGLRADHALGNLLIMQRFTEHVPLQIIDNFGRLRVLPPGHHTLYGTPGQTVSFVAFAAVKNLRLKGFRYPVEEIERRDDFLGVSNVLEGEEGTVSFDAGKIFCYEMFNNE